MTRNFDFSQTPGVGITVLPDLTTLPNVNDVLSVQQVTGGAVFTKFSAPTGGGGGDFSMAGVTKTDRSGVITLGGTAQSLMAANPSRKGWSFQNKSVANMWFNDLGAVADPVANNSTYLAPGAYYESEISGASIAAISVIGDATNAQFVAKEW